MPKFFTITTNTGFSNFNIYLLKDVSFVISDFLKENPHNLKYHLDTNDEENVLGKFEKMFQGEFVVFNEDDLLLSQKITKMLNFKNCPNFLKPEILIHVETKSKKYDMLDASQNNIFGVEISKNNLNNYLQYVAPQLFTIKTNKNEYKYNIFGVYASDVIKQILIEDPTKDNYIYDYDDEFNEFQSICDLFNFRSVDLNKNNMDSIKEIAEELQITLILKDVDNFINTSEKVSQTIDEQQTIIDSIEGLFEWLYKIKEKSVEIVARSIIESKWSKTEDDVKELAAFILQVIKTDFLLHQPLFELITQLDKEASETNELKILIPFISKQLMKKFNKKIITPANNSNEFKVAYLLRRQKIMAYFGFIYIMYKNGCIQKQDICNKLLEISNENPYAKLWFLPEMIELKLNHCILSDPQEMNTKFFVHDVIHKIFRKH